MISIRVLPIWGMEDEDFGDKLVISIVSPNMKHPNIKGNNVHRFKFHDIAEDYFLSTRQEMIYAMGKGIAEAIAEVAMNNRYVEEWVIHCEAGISRSPGVAIGLAKYIKTSPNRQALKSMFRMYNKHVCSLVEEAMKEKIRLVEETTENKIRKNRWLVVDPEDEIIEVLRDKWELATVREVRKLTEIRKIEGSLDGGMTWKTRYGNEILILGASVWKTIKWRVKE